jgi:hypothetical protein
MTLHFRLDEIGPGHKMFTVLCNGKNTGRLTMTHIEAVTFIALFDILTATTGHKLLLSGGWDEQ